MGRPKKPKEESKLSSKLDFKLAEIEKQFGKGTIMKLGEAVKVQIPVISTGALSLDLALGVGGIPRGRITEIIGSESSGKTSLSYSVIAQAQKSGGKCAFIDAEHAFDEDYAKKTGIKTEDLLVCQPDYGEQALDIVQKLIESEEITAIVVDSVASLVPKAELEGTHEDNSIGLQARLMSQSMRKLSGIISKTKTAVIFINQTRMKIGVSYGSNETTSGGVALKFYASVRIKLSATGSLKQGEEILGREIKAYVKKNKVAPPFKSGNFRIYFDEGISYAGTLLKQAYDLGIVEGKQWQSYKETKLGHGMNNSRMFLKENPEILEQIKQDILKAIKGEK